MIPNTNLHKIVGFVSGLVVTYAAKKGLTLDPTELSAVLLGVSLFVSAIVAKWTNPTGANTSEARQSLDAVVKTEVTQTAERAARR